MKTGKLRQSIEFFFYSAIDDGCGGLIEGFESRDPDLTWAKVIPAKQPRFEEPFTDQQLSPTKSYNITIRDNCGFIPELSDIIQFNGLFLEVQAISDLDERDYGYAIQGVHYKNKKYTILDVAGLFNVSGEAVHNQAGALIYNINGDI